jgi:hypothetical protein
MSNFFFQNFSDIIYNVKKKCTSLFNLLNINNNWDSKIFYELEIKKSYLKSTLRYCSETAELQKNILDALKKKFNQFSYTQFYPMMHLSNDRLEAGGFHYDQVDKRSMQTFWIAISDYAYSGLAVMPFNINNNFFNKLIIKSGLAKIISNNLTINKGDSFLWPGTLIHSGNFNNSSDYSLAMQMKIIDEKYDFAFEKNKKVSKLKIDYFDSCISSEENEIKDFYYFLNLVNCILEISKEGCLLEEKFNKVNRHIIGLKKNNNNININNMQVASFALAILSQRLIFSKKYIFSDFINNQQFTVMLDFASLILGSENLISKKRILDYDNELNDYLNLTLRNS